MCVSSASDEKARDGSGGLMSAHALAANPAHLASRILKTLVLYALWSTGVGPCCIDAASFKMKPFSSVIETPADRADATPFSTRTMHASTFGGT